MSEFDRAWEWRKLSGTFEKSEAIRIFHGPGEGHGESKYFAVDRFGDHYWVTEWESKASLEKLNKTRGEICKFLRNQGAISIVGLSRPEQGVAPESQILFGTPPPARFAVKEHQSRFWIQLEKTRHPGLFLDHEPLRKWLMGHSRGLRILNTFAYTGSLSVAAGLGGAKHVTTLDLSHAAIQWAKENMSLNGLSENGLSEVVSPDFSSRFISGDVFEWMPRLKREKECYDCVILDPPSFSHGKKGRFSTSKDLEKLHALAMELLSPDGILVTSINSANITWKKYEADILLATRTQKMSFTVIHQMDLPETFPTALGQSANRYLKGWILKRMT